MERGGVQVLPRNAKKNKAEESRISKKRQIRDKKGPTGKKDDGEDISRERRKKVGESHMSVGWGGQERIEGIDKKKEGNIEGKKGKGV